jgi:hypothetical protein
VGTQSPDEVSKARNQLIATCAHGKHVEVVVDDLNGKVTGLERHPLGDKTLDGKTSLVLEQAIDVVEGALSHSGYVLL